MDWITAQMLGRLAGRLAGWQLAGGPELTRVSALIVVRHSFKTTVRIFYRKSIGERSLEGLNPFIDASRCEAGLTMMVPPILNGVNNTIKLLRSVCACARV